MKEQIEKQAIEEMALELCRPRNIVKTMHHRTCGNCDTSSCDIYELCVDLYNAGYRKQSDIADDIIAIIKQRMARNIERLNGCQSDIWKVGYLAENEAYQDIKEIIEQRMKGGAE